MTATMTRFVTSSQQAPLNSAGNDYISTDGVRISASTYIDLSQTQRKVLLNAVRDLASATVEETPRTQSGIKVATVSSGLSQVETYLGCSLGTLRELIFSRGGVSIDLVLKLQQATGLEFVTYKDIEQGFKAKLALIKAFAASNPYNTNDA